MLKVCSKCTIAKESAEFYVWNNKISSRCKPCHRQARIDFKRANPEKDKISERKQTLRKRYGITLETYNNMFLKQNGRCGACGIHQSEIKRALCVDHDHKTGQIRGLLCSNCNVCLGNVKDSSEILFKLAQYLNDSTNSELADNSNVVELSTKKRNHIA